MASDLLRTVRRFAAAAAIVVVSQGAASAAPKRKILDGIVAIVDSTCITRSELSRFLVPFEKKVARDLADKPAERATVMARLRTESLQALVERRLFAAEAARKRIEVTTAEVDAAVASVAEQNHLTAAEILDAAKEQGLDVARYRDELRVQILEAKILQIDAPRRIPSWKDTPVDKRIEKMTEVREALLGELRERAFIELRL